MLLSEQQQLFSVPKEFYSKVMQHCFVSFAEVCFVPGSCRTHRCSVVSVQPRLLLLLLIVDVCFLSPVSTSMFSLSGSKILSLCQSCCCPKNTQLRIMEKHIQSANRVIFILSSFHCSPLLLTTEDVQSQRWWSSLRPAYPFNPWRVLLSLSALLLPSLWAQSTWVGASGVKNLPKQTCRAACCGDPVWINEQLKIACCVHWLVCFG